MEYSGGATQQYALAQELGHLSLSAQQQNYNRTANNPMCNPTISGQQQQDPQPMQGTYLGHHQNVIGSQHLQHTNLQQQSMLGQQQQPHLAQPGGLHGKSALSASLLSGSHLGSSSSYQSPNLSLSPSPISSLNLPSTVSCSLQPLPSVPSISQSLSPMKSLLGGAQVASASPPLVSPRPDSNLSSNFHMTKNVSSSNIASGIHGLSSAQLGLSSLTSPPSNESINLQPTPLVKSQLGSSWIPPGNEKSQVHNYPSQLPLMGQESAMYNAPSFNGTMQSNQQIPQSSYYDWMGQDYYQMNEYMDPSAPYNSYGFNCNYNDGNDPNACNDYFYNQDGYYYEYPDGNYPCDHLDRSKTPAYIDEIVEDLRPEEVRWFYKQETDKKWTPFIGYDSLRIEWKYRDILQEPKVCPDGKESSQLDKTDSSSCTSPKDLEEECSVAEHIVVRGGLYDVNVKLRRCESIYWKGETFMIVRGTWFYDGTWAPVEELPADRVEGEHLQHFRGHLLGHQRAEDGAKEVVHSLSLPEGHVDWFNAAEVYLSPDVTSSRLMRSVGKKLGFQKTGYKLHRGYSLEATADDKPPDITHLVFVIHGIGQKMDTGRIIRNAIGLRENVRYLKRKYFPSLARGTQTVEFFPVEWRSSLLLDPGIIDSITPQKILNIRQMLNASFMDIMYYNSPLYRDEILNGLTNEMNRLYTMFTQRNPYYEASGGKVSIVAHSLGCVITYDIVTGWDPQQQLNEDMKISLLEKLHRQMSKDNKDEKGKCSADIEKHLEELLQPDKKPTTTNSLNFKIENFFCLGSPLAVFLALRTKQLHGHKQDLIPQGLCQRLINIFHPADPVAYRMEPLLSAQYSTIAPCMIHSYNATDKIRYSEMPLEPIIIPKEVLSKTNSGSVGGCGTTGNGSGVKSDPEESENSTPCSSIPSTPSKGVTSPWSWWLLMKGSNKKTSDPSQDMSQTSQDMQGIIPERIDFVLREGSMESSYISALTSHTSYWNNLDVAHFMLNVLYPDAQPTQLKTAELTKT